MRSLALTHTYVHVCNEMPNSLKKHIKEDLQKKNLKTEMSFIKYTENRRQLYR